LQLAEGFRNAPFLGGGGLRHRRKYEQGCGRNGRKAQALHKPNPDSTRPI
jgi:hypothetical protein